MKADHARAKGLCCGVLALSVLYDVSRMPEMVAQLKKGHELVAVHQTII